MSQRVFGILEESDFQHAAASGQPKRHRGAAAFGDGRAKRGHAVIISKEELLLD